MKKQQKKFLPVPFSNLLPLERVTLPLERVKVPLEWGPPPVRTGEPPVRRGKTSVRRVFFSSPFSMKFRDENMIEMIKG
jgi:hypothetical protein